MMLTVPRRLRFDLPILPLGIFWLWIGVLLVAYTLPWVINPGNGLTVHAYDLAEWTSLSPAVRAQPLLSTALFLRLPLTLLTLLIALSAPQSRFSVTWLFHALGCLLLAIAQLPPLEFVMQPNDPNYQQQFALASLSLVGSFIGLTGRLAAYRTLLTSFFLLAMLVTSGMGQIQAVDLMRLFQLPAEMGLGFIGWVLVGSLWLLNVGVGMFKRNRAALMPPMSIRVGR